MTQCKVGFMHASAHIERSEDQTNLYIFHVQLRKCIYTYTYTVTHVHRYIVHVHSSYMYITSIGMQGDVGGIIRVLVVTCIIDINIYACICYQTT